jgi:hypothetical protein
MEYYLLSMYRLLALGYDLMLVAATLARHPYLGIFSQI